MNWAIYLERPCTPHITLTFALDKFVKFKLEPEGQFVLGHPVIPSGVQITAIADWPIHFAARFNFLRVKLKKVARVLFFFQLI
jgi:hypothetical protein